MLYNYKICIRIRTVIEAFDYPQPILTSGLSYLLMSRRAVELEDFFLSACLERYEEPHSVSTDSLASIPSMQLLRRFFFYFTVYTSILVNPL